MAAQLKDLTYMLKKIVGIRTLDSGKRKNSSGSESQCRDTKSSGPVNVLVIHEPVVSVENEAPETEAERMKIRKKNQQAEGDTIESSHVPRPKKSILEPSVDILVPQLRTGFIAFLLQTGDVSCLIIMRLLRRMGGSGGRALMSSLGG